MTYEIYRYIFIGFAALSGLMFVISVLLFFALNIPMVIGDLTGKNAKKAIEDIRSKNEVTGYKTYRSSAVNRERGKLTDKISPSGKVVPQYSDNLGGAMATSKINQADYEAMNNETSINHEQPRQVASAGETEILSQPESYSVAGETAVLAPQDLPIYEYSLFSIDYDITFIHSDEIIT